MHLYDRNGKPVYEVPYADPSKGMRDATLSDARKLDLVPSVTEINRIMAAPGLTWYFQEQAILAALTATREPNEPDESFVSRIRISAKEHAKIAADTGTAIHTAIEHLFQGKPVDIRYLSLAMSVKYCIIENYGDHKYIAEESFAHPKGFGGKTDLHCKSPSIIIDFKTKEKLKEKMAYDEHIMQLAAYAYGLKLEHPVTCVNVFISWDGEIELHEWTPEAMIRGWQMFKLCLNLWQLAKRYDSEY